MADKEKIRKGFERCLSGRMPYGCGECPYFGDLAYNDAWSCRLSLMRDAFDQTKEQEDQIKTRDESLEKAREEIKWLREMLKDHEKPDCEHAEHDGIGCLGYSECTQDDEPIESCKRCEKYTGNILSR